MRTLAVYLVVFLFAFSPGRRASAQDISLTFVGTNLMQSERPRGVYPEMEVALSVTQLRGERYDLFMAGHVATWRGRHSDFRCADVCPDVVYSAQLVGARFGLHRSEGRFHTRVAGGVAVIGGEDVGRSMKNMAVLQSVASLGLGFVAWLQPTATVYLRQPLDGSRHPAIGRISVGLGVTASFR